MRLAALALLAGIGGIGGIAHADVASDMKDMIEGLPMRDTARAAPVFSFTNNDPYWSGGDQFGNQPNFLGSGVDIKNLVTATSADGKVAWFAADVKGVPEEGECAPEPCKPNRDPPLHVTGLVEKSGKDWRWVAWHVAPPLTAKDQAALKKQETLPDPIPRDLRKADEVVKAFEAVMNNPAELAKMVADRKDVVLYGSAGSERYVGAAKVKKQLAAWNLAMKARDGVQAGLVGQNVAWIAMNLDAKSMKNLNAKADPYRLLAVLEKSGDNWKIVQLHFSVDVFTYKKP